MVEKSIFKNTNLVKKGSSETINSTYETQVDPKSAWNLAPPLFFIGPEYILSFGCF